MLVSTCTLNRHMFFPGLPSARTSVLVKAPFSLPAFPPSSPNPLGTPRFPPAQGPSESSSPRLVSGALSGFWSLPPSSQLLTPALNPFLASAAPQDSGDQTLQLPHLGQSPDTGSSWSWFQAEGLASRSHRPERCPRPRPFLEGGPTPGAEDGAQNAQSVCLTSSGWREQETREVSDPRAMEDDSPGACRVA